MPLVLFVSYMKQNAHKSNLLLNNKYCDVRTKTCVSFEIYFCVFDFYFIPFVNCIYAILPNTDRCISNFDILRY